MSTPLYDAVDSYAKKDYARFHMPGHKGILPWLGDASKFDVTEVDGCDNLYAAKTVIADCEKKFTELYQSRLSMISAGGSTLCIQTMISLAVKPHETMICGRGCHVAAVNTMALLDVVPHWVFPENDEATCLAKAITAAQIEAALTAAPHAKAVYITSPNYYGFMADIAAISKVCHTHGVPLLVDDAHGAYLRFLEPSKHPINLGADMCNDSLHKTLPVLTGGAMLHINNPKFVPDAKRIMSIFGTTSPSYLIMMSIDKALDTLNGDFAEKLKHTTAEVARLEKIAAECGFLVPTGERDPVRLTLGFGEMGYTADEIFALFRDSGIEPEMVIDAFAILMSSPWNRDEDFQRLEKFIRTLPQKPRLEITPHDKVVPKNAMSLREAVFSPLEEVSVEDSVGRVAASIIAPCPPGIPLAIPGEAIDENFSRYLKSYGVLKLNVVQ